MKYKISNYKAVLRPVKHLYILYKDLYSAYNLDLDVIEKQIIRIERKRKYNEIHNKKF